MADNSFHAIKIITTINCCENARNAGSRLILSNEFETQILAKCDRAQCECSFKHFTDRRQSKERRNFNKPLDADLYAQRKQPYGRRAVDIHNMSRDSQLKHLLLKQKQGH